MVEFKNVTFKYTEDIEPIIKDLSFSVSKGDFVSIIGASGYGKSTIFRLINGLEKVQNGDIFYEGKSIYEQSNFCAFMPQKDLLFPWRTIKDNLAIPLEIKKIPKQDRIKMIDDILNEVNLSEYKNKYPKDLSGGMKQRISFARTLLTGSDVLLLDEPFSALDSLTKIDMQEWLLDQWVKHKKTIIFITHDVEEAIFLSNKIYLIKEKPIIDMEEIHIPIEYPRDRSFLKNNEIIELKETLINSLRKKV